MKVLLVAAHPDDEVLGPGGTVTRHVAEGDEVTILILADHGSVRYDEERMREVRRAARAASSRMGVSEVRFGELEDQKLDVLPILEVTQRVEAMLQEVQPEIVYTHHRGDINRDHTVVHEATLTAARPYSAPFVRRVLCYETPSATEWAGPYPESAFVPNLFVDISDHLEAKLQAMAEYPSELREAPHPRSLEALRSHAAHWGSVIGVTAAEPFMLVREILR
jgi:LmbE family N-acetylglucosaminyl deacetylase